ncbi:MAG: ABC transporter ATP-binding protein [Deltaproteobacteria bacterium]|jgi:putative ABC transport system ATP-binding protein|nr:ABC transporter ATP-binding protein [Deltaproteobacteria bacterium]
MILETKHINKSYLQADNTPVQVIKDINFGVNSGETVSITGPSGSGKTTLLSLIAGLDRPDTGEIILDNRDITQMNEDTLAKYRAEKIGFIFQQFHLMPHLSVAENIALPMEILKKQNINPKIDEVLESVSLSHRKNQLPSTLSGGESQRVAIARSLAIEPTILLADEPTGNLDVKTGEQIEALLFDLVEKNNMTLVIVTHNLNLANHCQKKLNLTSGQLL